MVWIVSKIKPVYILIFHFFKIHFNIILPFMSTSSKWSLYLTYSNYNSVSISLFSHVFCMPHAAYTLLHVHTVQLFTFKIFSVLFSNR